MRRASRALCSASVWASFVLSSGHARAEDSARPTQTPSALVTEPTAVTSTGAKEPAKATGPDPTSDNERAAEAAYQRALTTYGAGDIKGAYDQMRESYRLSQRPELLYNLARLEQELQECQAALEDYRGYLVRVPQGRYRDAAEQASRELAQECPRADAAAPLAAPHAAPVAESKPVVAEPKHSVPGRAPTYWTEPRVLAWSAIVAGVLAGGGSVYFYLGAIAARDADQKQANASPPPAPHDPVFYPRQHRDETWAQVLGVTGGALVAGGVLMLVLDPRAPNRTSAHLDVWPGRFEAFLSRSF